jgi:hypothetical protein
MTFLPFGEELLTSNDRTMCAAVDRAWYCGWSCSGNVIEFTAMKLFLSIIPSNTLSEAELVQNL